MQGQIQMMPIRVYKGWRIYAFQEASPPRGLSPADRWITVYLAHKARHCLMQGVDLPDLIADIDEAERLGE